MKKQYTIPLVLFLLGMVITIVGALFKLKHWPGANIMLTIGMLAEATALISLIVIVFKRII